MSLELVVTKNGKIKCSLGAIYQTATPDPTDPTDRSKDIIAQMDLGADIPFGEDAISPQMTFGINPSTQVTASSDESVHESNYTTIDNYPVMLDKIILTILTFSYNTFVNTAVSLNVTLNSKLTNKSLCENDVGDQIILLGTSNSVTVTGTNPSGVTGTFTLKFEIVDAGQTSTTAE